MDSQSLIISDESFLADAVEEPNNGRFPRQVDVAGTEYREVNVDQLSESDFEGMKDSGLAYSDHDYFGSYPNAKVLPETFQFPVMGGVTDQYLNGETNDPCAERTDNRVAGVSISSASGSAVRKPQHPGGTTSRAAKGEDFLQTGSPQQQYPQGKAVTYKNVTQPKKSGRPKNETRELAGDRLMGRAMVKAGLQTHLGLMQPHHTQFLHSMHPVHDHSLTFRGAAPLVTPARGQKITPRGRSTAGLRRDIPDDDNGMAYPMMPTQQATANRHTSLKKLAPFRSAQAAEDAHTREMMQAAENALAPSNASISTMNVMMPAQPPHDDTVVLPVQHQPRSHRDEGDLPRTPGKGHLFSPITSPQPGGFGRTSSESQEIDIHMLQEPIRTNPDGLPVTPGRDHKTTGRSRMSISDSTGSQSASPQRPFILSPPRLQAVQPRPITASPRQVALGGPLKSPTTGPTVYLTQGPSTMASVQMLMSSKAPMPSLQSHTQSLVVQRRDSLDQSSSGRAYYDATGVQAAPLVTGSGSSTYTPRRRKEKEADEAVEAAVSRNVKTILRAENSHRLPSTSSHTLSPRNDISDEDIGGRHVNQIVHESKRKDQKPLKRMIKQASEDESEDEKWEISCICGEKEDDGEEMVRCDQCILRWEHVDCIFPRTKKAPSGLYFCHVCKPRATELTPEQARAYQDRVKRQKDESKNQDLKRKLAERVKRKEENSRKPPLRSASKATASKIDKLVHSSYREIEKNEYSTNAKRFLSISRLPASHSSNVEILRILRKNPRARSLIVEPNIYGVVTLEEISEGDYIAELCGYVSLQKECSNRDPIPGSLNDSTFLFETDNDKIIIDARKCGNFAKTLRKSCKPNAELEAIMSGSELHIMIKAIEKVEIHDEVSIKLDDDWMKKPKPLQGCGCDKEKEKEKGICELERFFNESTNLASSRRSLPDNGTTFKGGRSPIRRAVTEKKKVASAKKTNAKKGQGQRKGSMKLPRHSRTTKGGSERNTADDESERIDENETEKEYEESTADEREKNDLKDDKEDMAIRRTKKNSESSIEVNERERDNMKKTNAKDKDTLVSLTRSTRGTRIRNDTDVETIKYDTNEKIKSLDTSRKESGEKKSARKSCKVKESGEKEVKSMKKMKKPWPVMDYSLPSERNKPSREDRKLQAMCERLEKEKKRSGLTPRGRPPTTKEEREKAKESGRAAKEEKSLSSGRGKRRTENEDEAARNDSSTTAASTPILPPPKKRLAATEARKDASSPIPSLAPSSSSSMTSPMIDETTVRSTSSAGKKRMLQRYRETEKEKAAAEALDVKEKGASLSSICTPTRGVKEKGEGHRQEMRRHAIHLRDSLPITAFSLGDMDVERSKRENKVTSCTVGPFTLPTTDPLVPPSGTTVPSISSPKEGEKITKKNTSVSYEEYKKRKKTGDSLSGEGKNKKNEKKEELPKKSFMPHVDASVYVPPSLPNVTLPGLDEDVGLDELKRRVYDDSPHRGRISSSMGKTIVCKAEPTPKRQSINDRLKNEFSLPNLSTPSSSVVPMLTTPSSSMSTVSTTSISSLSYGSQLTPTGGRTHKNRLSDTRASNVAPPGEDIEGLMAECPRPTSLDPSSILIPSNTSVTSPATASFLQRVASIRSSK